MRAYLHDIGTADMDAVCKSHHVITRLPPPAFLLLALFGLFLPFLTAQSLCLVPPSNMPALPPDNTSRPSTSSNNQNRTTAQPNVKSENGNVQNHVDDAPAGDENNNEDDNAGPPSSRTNKRRLLGVDPSLILSEERSKRTKRTPSPDAEDDIKEGSYDPKDSERAKTLGMQIYQKIMTKKDRE